MPPKGCRNLLIVAVQLRHAVFVLQKHLKAGGEQNRERQEVVTAETIGKVIEAAPDVQWRTIVALCRFGGLRCPSEVLELKWRDINWETSRFKVTSPKTKRHGKGYRFVPLFPELLPFLRDCFEQAEEGATHVITRYRDTNANLRTQLLRIVEKAGVEPWQKPFQNLRSSRETELTNQFPIHVVADWLGNTPQVADKHYLQTTEQHFQQAAECADSVQKCANSVAEQSSTAEQETKKTPTIAEVLLADSLCCSPMLLAQVPPSLGDTNKLPNSRGKQDIARSMGAEAGADSTELDSRLADIIAAWQFLSDESKRQLWQVANELIDREQNPL